MDVFSGLTGHPASLLAVGAVALALLSHDGSAWVNGKAVVVLEHVTRLHDDIAPDWPQPAGEGCYRVKVTGEPLYTVDMQLLGTDGDGGTARTVTFAPGSSGTKSATVSIAHNATGSPTAISLSGTANDVVVAAPAAAGGKSGGGAFDWISLLMFAGLLAQLLRALLRCRRSRPALVSKPHHDALRARSLRRSHEVGNLVRANRDPRRRNGHARRIAQPGIRERLILPGAGMELRPHPAAAVRHHAEGTQQAIDVVNLRLFGLLVAHEPVALGATTNAIGLCLDD